MRGGGYLMTHSTHFIYSYMASDILYRTIQVVIEDSTTFVRPVVEREIAQWDQNEGSLR